LPLQRRPWGRPGPGPLTRRRDEHMIAGAGPGQPAAAASSHRDRRLTGGGTGTVPELVAGPGGDRRRGPGSESGEPEGLGFPANDAPGFKLNVHPSLSPTQARKLRQSKMLRSRKSRNVEVSYCPRVKYSGTLRNSELLAFHFVLVQW
jgi:hypothetical protein